MKEELEEIDEKLIKIDEERKMSSWHLRVHKKMVWPVKRLAKRRKWEKREPTDVKVLDSDFEDGLKVGEDNLEASLEGLESEQFDLWEKFAAIEEGWQNKLVEEVRYQRKWHKDDVAAAMVLMKEERDYEVSKGHEEAQMMIFFPRM